MRLRVTAGPMLCIGHYEQKRLGKTLVTLQPRKKSRTTIVNWPHERACVACHEVKAFSEFAKSSSGAHGHRAVCRPCDKVEDRARRLLRNYGLTVDEFEGMLEAQGGGCAICGRTDPGGRGAWHVDHDHACCPPKRACHRCRRGLLCHTCNVGLGQFQDDERLLLIAADYLSRRK